jgi:hypothetical protein
LRTWSPREKPLRAGPEVTRCVAIPCVPYPTLSRLAVLELIPMLLQDDTHQLTARPDASLGKELLKCGFDRALRHSESRRNFFIRKTLEHAIEHLLFSLGEWLSSIFLRGVVTSALRAVRSCSWFSQTHDHRDRLQRKDSTVWQNGEEPWGCSSAQGNGR